MLLFLPCEDLRLLDSSLRIFRETEQSPGLLSIAEVLNCFKDIKDSQLIEIRNFSRCFLNITKSWEKFFVEKTIKPNNGVCIPAPCLTYLIFKLCLIHLYHIHQMIYHVALYTWALHLFTAPPPFQYIGAPPDVQSGGQWSSQEKQCHCCSPLSGHAAIVCACCSLCKCGINAGYPIINITPAALVQLQAFIMYIYRGCCLLMISGELLIYRGGRSFSEPFMADQHYLWSSACLSWSQLMLEVLIITPLKH